MKGTHHLHIRKRVTARLEPFPASTRWKRVLDRVVLTVGVIGPVTALPQVLKVFVSQDASGLVAFSWGAWAAMNIPWVLYGLAHKEMPIAVTYSLWFFVNSSICIGALWYGGSLF